MKKLLIAAFLCVVTAPSAKAFTYPEIDDSGQLISTAQIIGSVANPATSTATDPSLTSITGAISSTNNADLFGIFLTAGQLFTATTTPVQAVNYDSQLFLFDSQGFGLVANDNINNSFILSSISFTPTTSGIYYLGISGYNYDPRSANNDYIFADTRTGQISPVAGAGALASWTNRTIGTPTVTFSYAIGLTGAAPVPEPVMGGSFLAFAGLGMLSAFRRKKQMN